MPDNVTPAGRDDIADPTPTDPGGAPRSTPTVRLDRYARRRRRALSVLATLGCLVVFSLISQLGSGLPESAPVAEAAGPLSDREVSGSDPHDFAYGVDPVDDELDIAAQHQVAAGTYNGYPGTLRHAAGTTTIVVVSGTGADCRYGGIVDGVRRPAVSDPTGQACDPGQLAALQIELDRQAAARTASLDADAARVLAIATETVQRYAATNFVDGARSFTGLPGEVADVTVQPTDRHDQVVLTTSAGGTCWARTTTPTAAEPASRC